MTEAEAWLAQVESDFAAARSVFKEDDLSTYCQSIAKCQQVVEKSINVIDAVLREQGVFLDRVKPDHYPLKMINRLVRLPLRQNPDLAANMQRIFTRWGADIHDLCLFAQNSRPQGRSTSRTLSTLTRTRTGLGPRRLHRPAFHWHRCSGLPPPRGVCAERRRRLP